MYIYIESGFFWGGGGVWFFKEIGSHDYGAISRSAVSELEI